nr:NADH dehydrogenase [ubiquinone] 1 beta subcomplex subunit 8, mitochondrial [Megalopta genalis]
MAALMKYRKLSAKILEANIPLIQVRHYDKIDNQEDLTVRYARLLWTPDMKEFLPEPTPRTLFGRKRAAEKYGLHVMEYKPSEGKGDYPDLPMKGVEAQDPYYPWDFPALRRNYGQCIHYDFDLMGVDRFAYGVRSHYDYYKCSAIFIILYIFMVFVTPEIFPNTKPIFVRPQFPYDGKVHYTFEPAR